MILETKRFSGSKSLWTILRSRSALRPFVDCIDMSNLSKNCTFHYHSISRELDSQCEQTHHQYSTHSTQIPKKTVASYISRTGRFFLELFAAIFLLFFGFFFLVIGLRKLPISFIFIHRSRYTFSNLVAKINWKPTYFALFQICMWSFTLKEE